MTFLGVLLYVLIVTASIQVIFYIFFFGKFAFSKLKQEPKSNVPVSVIICAKNEAENLKRFLPSIISQDYQTFEIILINDASKDETLEIMEDFASKDDKIKIVNVKNVEAFWGNKKYALTLGIKVTQYEHLLFTDADCVPVSKHWISEMSACFNEQKSIVLGYSPYKKIKTSFLNKIIRFETLVTAVNYFSFAKIGIPYMGVGRNLAYKKSEFFKTNGFINHIDILSGDDDLFINQVATSKNTAICISESSFITSLPKESFKNWFNQKRRHVSTAKRYKLKHKILLANLYVTKLLFWVLITILLITGFKWPIVVSILITKLIFQFLIFGFSAKKLGEKDLILLLPFLEIFLVIMQLTIFMKNLISKPNHWK